MPGHSSELVSSSSSDLLQRSQFIRAGAGAGKTTRLIATFLDFVREFRKTHNRFPRVVMTTFTRKATQEVKERLLVSALQKGEKEIFEYINQRSFVQISTIHGLLNLFLKQYSELLQFPQEIKIVDGPEYERKLKRQINELLKSNPQYLELLESYTFVKLVAVSAKALELKAQYSDFHYISEADLRNFAQQQRKKIADTIDRIQSGSDGAGKSWPPYLEYLGQVKNLVNKNDMESLLGLLEEAPKKPMYKEASPSIDPGVHELIVELKDNLLEDLFDSEEFIKNHEKLNKLFYSYINDLYEISTQQKRLTGELTMGDLENLTLQIIEKYPAAAREFSETWDYFMLDEYQDTSPVQVKILNHLIGQKPCFVVGDPQQSIYLFRGARSEVFEQKQKQMAEAGAQIDFLETNYRSEPSLMKFINEFFAEYSRQFKPMIPKSEAGKDAVEFDALYARAETQAAGAIHHVRTLLDKGISPQDICILSRNNKNLEEAAAIAAATGIHVQLQAAAGFEETREVQDLIALNKFLNNPHDDENFVCLVRSPWFFITDEDLMWLGEIKRQKKLSLWSCLLQSEKAPLAGSLKRYLDLFDAAGVLQTTRRFLIEKNFVNYSGFYDPNGKREANIFKYIDALAQAEKRPGFSLGVFLEEQFQSLQLESGAGKSEAQPVIQPDCVTLMTIHTSKGLQFKHVIVLGFSDKLKLSNISELSFDTVTQKFSLALFNEETMKQEYSNWSKSLRNAFNERERAESERLLYVAMTRAIKSLCLILDTSKRADKSSWAHRISWPQPGAKFGDGFSAGGIEYSGAIATVEAKKVKAGDVRKKFSEPSDEVSDTRSVTDLLSVSSPTGADFNQQLLNLHKAQYGSDLHRVFESLKFVDAEKLKKQLPAKDQDAVNYLLTTSELNLQQILNKGHNEWGFGLKTKIRFIQGQIDLWADLEDEVHVIDYKTGSSHFKDKALEQLAYYTCALYEMKLISPKKKIVHSVIYPLEKKIEMKKYSDHADFQKQLPKKIAEMF
ncbi:MAG: exonuclease RexA [Pseudobdellovibrio sp.]|nr:exonuclease RexA [Pseudobdellovibrio sp.]